jgi:hypothetical protein
MEILRNDRGETVMPKRKKNFEGVLNRCAKKRLRAAVNFSKNNWFIPKKVNEDGVNIAYGPRNGILFINDANEALAFITPLEKLQAVFTQGILGNMALFLPGFIPYLEKKFGSALLGTDIEKQQSINWADEYGYVYVIDASPKNDLICIPISRFNAKNATFMQGSDLDFHTREKIVPNFYIVASSLRPHAIVGAFATQYLAFSLNISENTLILNPNYLGDVSAIKSKLKIPCVKAFKDCVIKAKNYREAKAAYQSGSTGLNSRFFAIINNIKKIHTRFGLESVIYALPKIKPIVECTPFTSLQLGHIKKVVRLSRKVNTCVQEAANACLQFEQGCYQGQSLIRFLPEIVRHKIYSYVYPKIPANEFIHPILSKRFSNAILSRKICFFPKQFQDTASQTDPPITSPRSVSR